MFPGSLTKNYGELAAPRNESDTHILP